MTKRWIVRCLILLTAVGYLSVLGLILAKIVDDRLHVPPGQVPLTLKQTAEGQTLHTPAAVFSSDAEVLLLPVGPDEISLPGDPTLWYLLRQALESELPLTDNGFAGLQLLNSHHQADLSALSHLDLGRELRSAYRYADHLYLLTTKGRLLVVDVAQPARPKLVASEPQYSGIAQMVGRGATLYLLSQSSDRQLPQLKTYSLTIPEQPQEIDRQVVSPLATSLVLFKAMLGVLSSEKIGEATIDFYTCERQPVLVRSISGLTIDITRGVLTVGDYLFGAQAQGGLKVYAPLGDSPHQPVATLSLPARLDSMSRTGNLLFIWGETESVARASRGEIFVIDIADQLRPSLIYRTEGQLSLTAKVLFSGMFSYLVTKQGRLTVHGHLTDHSAASGLPRIVAERLLQGEDGTKTLVVDRKVGSSPEVVIKAGSKVSLHGGELPIVTGNANAEEQFLLGDGKLAKVTIANGNEVVTLAELEMPSGICWLVSSGERIYLGGDDQILVVESIRPHALRIAGRIALPGLRSWSALIADKNLLVCAGRDGLMRFSLENPDQPVSKPTWDVPRHYAKLVDLRRLIREGNRIYAAAGPAGLLVGHIGVTGQVSLEDWFALDSPVNDLLVADGMALLMATNRIHCLDVRPHRSIQEIGFIGFSGVTDVSLLPPGIWAARADSTEWVVLPWPRIVKFRPVDEGVLMSPLPSFETPYRFHVNLFNAYGVSRSAETLVVGAAVQTGSPGRKP